MLNFNENDICLEMSLQLQQTNEGQQKQEKNILYFC